MDVEEERVEIFPARERRERGGAAIGGDGGAAEVGGEAGEEAEVDRVVVHEEKT